jgi:hypothetical protein
VTARSERGVAPAAWGDDWRAQRAYHPFFCEENVWRLLADGALPEPGAALFVTNAARTVAMWGQRAARQDPILWDYHVAALLPDAGLVVDLDDRERVARPLGEWLGHAFRPARAAWRPRFRLVPRAAFLAVFSSDRSHMLDAAGTARAPFPPWPAPFRAELGNTLVRLLDLDDAIAGEVTDAAGLLHALRPPRR